MKEILIASGSLFVANIFAVLMVQAEARGRSSIAAVTEMAFYLANIVATKFAIDNFHLGVIVACCFSAGVSTYIATHHGHKGIEDVTDVRQDADLDALEARLSTLEASLTPSREV
ncbi:MAG: hypothetical protein EBS66_10670 [Betaproteobacteria bacterium]|nr:hypothetical protein [Betaproteobacteria bacterium]